MLFRSQDRSGRIRTINGNDYETKSIDYIVLRNNRIHKDLLRRSANFIQQPERVKSEDGFSYCFSVPSTFLVLRRNDNIFITGNSGKSFLIGVLDKFFKEHFNNPFVVQASAYTGKAATVLAEKGLNSSTLHHMLYVPVVKKYLDQETDTLTKYVR